MARARQNHIIEGRGAKRLEKGRVARVPGSAAIKNSHSDVALLAIKSALLSSACVTAFDVATR